MTEQRQRGYWPLSFGQPRRQFFPLKHYESFRLIVDYRKSLEKMVIVGEYDDVDDDIIAEHFPIIQRDGIVEFEAQYFNFTYRPDRIFSKDVTQRIKEWSTISVWYPGKIEHLLSFGAQFPDEQRTYKIVGLGSVVGNGDYSRVPYLLGGNSCRMVGLEWLTLGFHPSCLFLAVRKVQV